jgi:hypothetical protein
MRPQVALKELHHVSHRHGRPGRFGVVRLDVSKRDHPNGMAGRCHDVAAGEQLLD